MAYPNGEIPESRLVKFDGALFMPGTAAKYRRLIQLGLERRGVRYRVSGPDDAYRRLSVQWHYYNTMKPGMAAYPGTSSHGGWYDGAESGAVDIGNWGQVGRALFYQDARDAGFIPNYFDWEPWHIVDLTPWAAKVAPAPITTDPFLEDEMPDSMFAVVDGVPSWCWLNWATGTVYAVHTQAEADWIGGYMGSVRSDWSRDPIGGDKYKNKLALFGILCPQVKVQGSSLTATDLARIEAMLNSNAVTAG